MMTYI